MKAISCVFGNRSHRCFNCWHRWTPLKSKSMGKVLHIYEKTKALRHCGNYCTGWKLQTFRPELVIDRSSPVKQNIGDFVDEEEKILSLFKVTNIFAFSQIFLPFQGDKYFCHILIFSPRSRTRQQGECHGLQV